MDVHVWRLCVIEILMTIPIHMCRASIWILLSEHMSGKSAPSNRIQAQMMSFYIELTCHLSAFPHQVTKAVGLDTHRLPDGGGIYRLSRVLRYI